MKINLKYFRWIIIILGIITPFIDYAVIIQMFFLIIPFAIILFISIVNFIFNLIEYKKEVFKKKSTVLLSLLPIFLISQLISSFTVDRIQRFRSNIIIKKIEAKEIIITSIPTTNFGIKYHKLKNNVFVVQYNRGFLISEKYYNEEKKWKSYGWND